MITPQEGPLDELVKRCRTICGDDTSGCFIANAKHLDCITDIVINKIWAAREIIGMGTGKNTCKEIAGILNIATNEMDELIDWVQNLQTLQKRHLNEANKEVVCRR
mgnify:CR=1 FL=1